MASLGLGVLTGDVYKKVLAVVIERLKTTENRFKTIKNHWKPQKKTNVSD